MKIEQGQSVTAEQLRELAKAGRVRGARVARSAGSTRTYDIPEQCQAAGLPAPVAEHRFHARRKWAVDFAWTAEKIALEIEGGAFSLGRHVRGKGFINDMVKYDELTLAGWLLVRVTPQQVDSGEAMDLLQRAFAQRSQP